MVDEIDALYARPIFTIEERNEYFQMTPPEQSAISQLKTPISQTYFFRSTSKVNYFLHRQKVVYSLFSKSYTLCPYHSIQ